MLRTRSSWQDLPEEFDKWETAYKRYRDWGDLGLWPHILAALKVASAPQPPHVSL